MQPLVAVSNRVFDLEEVVVLLVKIFIGEPAAVVVVVRQA